MGKCNSAEISRSWNQQPPQIDVDVDGSNIFRHMGHDGHGVFHAVLEPSEHIYCTLKKTPQKRNQSHVPFEKDNILFPDH